MCIEPYTECEKEREPSSQSVSVSVHRFGTTTMSGTQSTGSGKRQGAYFPAVSSVSTADQ